jgi:alpha-D-ribose 1-methylphosphonate 5-triphosphate diphosphatase PhnM
LNLRLAQTWFPEWPLVEDINADANGHPDESSPNVFLDVSTWLNRYETRATSFDTNTWDLLCEPLRESWEVTSDTCAAYLALACKAQQLVVLKSCDTDCTTDLQDLANSGIVDPEFPRFAKRPADVRLVNLNSEISQLLY